MARGKKVEPHVASLIRICLDAGRLSCVQIAKELGLSAMTIYRIRLNYDLYNAPYPPSIATKGRPQAFTPEQQSYILSLFNDRPSMKLHEAVLAASERFDITVDYRTISNILLRHKWSRKSALVTEVAEVAE